MKKKEKIGNLRNNKVKYASRNTKENHKAVNEKKAHTTIISNQQKNLVSIQ